MTAPRPRAEEFTRLLHAYEAGDSSALDAAMPLVYAELRALAKGAFAAQNANHTLQPTALVHEAWLRLVKGAGDFESRHHFLAVASKAMRQILINHARDQKRLKRGGGARGITLGDPVDPSTGRELDLVALDDALEKLTQLDERQARVVELRFFGGLTVEEAADILEVSPRTVRADWTVAKAWLQRELLAS